MRWGVLFGVCLVCSLGLAQPSQFGFDPCGNLITQLPEVLAPLQIIGQPQPQLVAPGESASFLVIAADTTGLSYQWRFNGSSIAGATSDTLLLTNARATNEGSYTVILSNAIDSVTSSVAQLYIDTRGVGMPDSWQMLYFGNLNQSPTGDFDGDGVSNLQEFLDGTNPADSNSARFRLSVSGSGAVVDENPNRRSYTDGEVVTLTATPIPPSTFRIWGGDVITTNNPVSITMSRNKSVVAYAGPANIFWTNTANGDWNNPANWSPNLIPGINDNVTIANAVIVTVTNSVECAGLILGIPGVLPTLSVSGTLTLDGLCSWYAGTISGGGKTIISPTATLTIDNPSTVYINSCTLENHGVILWPGANDISLNSADFTNAPGALFLAQNSASLTGTGSVFDNSGTFRKSDNAASSTVRVVFNNLGTVDIQTGSLTCNANLNNNGIINLAPGTTNILAYGGTSTGSWNTPATAQVTFTGTAFSPSFSLNPGVQLNGSGVYRLEAQTVNLNTDAAVQNMDLFSTLAGPGNLTISNVLNWLSGTMSGNGANQTFIAPGATLNLPGPYTVFFNARTLENAGTIAWSAASTIQMGGGVLTNRSGGLVDVQNAASMTDSSSRFDNDGILRIQSGTGAMTFAATLNNWGSVELQTGTLTCNGNLNNNGVIDLAPGTTNILAHGGTSTGSWNTPTTAQVTFTGNGFTPPFTLNPGAQLNGPGVYRLEGQTVNLNTDAVVQHMDLISTLAGSGNLTISNVLNWLAGTMNGNAANLTLIAPGATLNLPNPYTVFLNSRTLENAGTVTWSGGSTLQTSGAVLTNRSGALFDIRNATTITGSGSRFDNAGTFRNSNNTGTTILVGLSLNNYGTVDLQAGILQARNGYVSAPGALLNCGLGGTIAATNYGQLQVAGTVSLDGALSVNLLPGYSPATNDAFTILTAGVLNNTFTTFSYPTNRVTMQLTNTPNSVVLAVSGVLPWAAPALLFPPSLVGSNLFLSWSATPNFTYRLEYTPSLSQTDWVALPGDVTATSGTVTKTDPITSTNRFYRVRILP